MNCVQRLHFLKTARSSCLLYSLIESAKENGLNPQEYLRCVFERAPFCCTKDD
ncbi:MAG: transposase domain-containing protein [Treponema sp.]|nr:transposase domain-containing protein [Treponema sp.]